MATPTTRDTTPNPYRDTTPNRGDRQSSSRHQGLARPNEDLVIRQRLDHVGLDERGDILEDDLRDRASNGLPGRDLRDVDDERRQPR